MSCQLICPNLRCRKILKVPDEVRGKIVRCHYCQTMLRVPTAPRADAGPETGTGEADASPDRRSVA